HNIHPSIFYRLSCSGSRGWSLSQHLRAKAGTPWTSHQFIAGLTYRHKQPSTLTFTPKVIFTKELESQTVGESASLRCETTKPGASVGWRCGDRVLASSSKYHLKQEGTIVELVIYKLQGADAGEYSCDTGSQKTSAVLTVQGRSFYI
uniref:Ig-like domain-containing protein n=1 Tax=Mola mola TaxID=94237 RepID=A0A3Q3XG12_MOLML